MNYCTNCEKKFSKTQLIRLKNKLQKFQELNDSEWSVQLRNGYVSGLSLAITEIDKLIKRGGGQ